MMVSPEDLIEDYGEVLKSGELERPQKHGLGGFWTSVILAVVIFSLTFWTVAWLY